MKTLIRNAWKRCLGLLGILSICSLATAQFPDVVNGDFSGTDVEYYNVRQNSQTDPIPSGSPGPYGPPEIVDDNVLTFGIPDFAAISDNDTPFDATDGFLAFTLEANPGYSIKSLNLNEFGAIQMHSNAGGSLETWTNVIAPVFVEVKDVILADGSAEGLLVPVPEPMFIKMPFHIMPHGSSPPGWNSMNDSDIVQWIGMLDIDLVQAVADEFPDIDNVFALDGIARLDLTMNNILTSAVEDDNSFAFVDKKHTDVRPLVAPVNTPEPSGFALVMLTLMVVGATRRKLTLA